MKKLRTLESKIRYRVRKSKDNAFVIKDFIDLSDRDQITRVLRKMINDDEIMRIGTGIYVKTRKSKITNKVQPSSGLRTLTEEAFKKLKIKTVPSSGEIDYAQGKTTQIPTGMMIGVKTRVSRKIGYNGRYMKYEYTK